MKKFTIVLIVLLLSVACMQSKKQMNDVEKKAETAKLWDLVDVFFKSLEDESWLDMKAVLAEDCMVYGTDVTDVDQGFAQLEPHMQQSFDVLEYSKISNYRDKNVRICPNLAILMFNSTWDVNFTGQQVSIPLRLAFTFEKINGKWLISQILFSLPSVAQTNEELVR